MLRSACFIGTFLFLSTGLISCSDNVTSSGPDSELIISAEGLVEHLGGDCSAVQVRTRTLGSADLGRFRKLRVEINGMSDADLSSIQIYYVQNGEQVYLLDLRNRDEINSTQSVEISSPGFSGDLYSRVTLKSSVCTGQIYFLTLRDLKIFGIR